MKKRPKSPATGPMERLSFGRVEITRTPDELVIEAPGARNRAWAVAAVLFGVPWLTLMLAVSVWYLGWGMPDGLFIRVLLWLVTMLLTFALHVLALLSLWGAVYARIGTETITIDGELVAVVRRAGRVPIKLHIRRTIIEKAVLLPVREGKVAHPRIEVKAWRSAIRFGAGLEPAETEGCVEALTTFFERAEEARHALTPGDAGDTIAPTRPETDAGTNKAKTGTSRTTGGLSKRAGTVKARGVRWFRKSPRSLGPKGFRAK